MSNKFDEQYLDILKDILENGCERETRTGINTISVFNRQMRIDLTEGFPILTTKKVFFRGVFEEMQFFLRGKTNSKLLEEKGVKYWKGNTTREFLDSRGLTYLPEGEMGCGYGHQFRNFGGEHPMVPATKGWKGFDQLADVAEKLQTNPYDRRIIIDLWCPTQLDYAALPPCHLYIQFYCNPEKKELSCFFLLRSNDFFLGNPTNVIQYALLTHYLAQLIGYTPKELVFTGIDVHLYTNHIEQVKEQLRREPKELPKLIIKKNLKTLEDILSLEYEDIELINYNPHPSIKAPMAV